DGHLHRARASQHLPRLVITVAHHQPAAILVPLGSVRRDIGVHLGPQRLGQHPPRAFPHDLIDQRRAILGALVVRAVVRDYGEHRVIPSRPARQRRSLLETPLGHREGTPLPGRSTGLKHCSAPWPAAATTARSGYGTWPIPRTPNRSASP